MSTKLTRLYKKKLAQSKPFFQDPSAPVEYKKWPQETKVLNDFMLERGIEPMVEDDEELGRDLLQRHDDINPLDVPVGVGDVNGLMVCVYWYSGAGEQYNVEGIGLFTLVDGEVFDIQHEDAPASRGDLIVWLGTQKTRPLTEDESDLASSLISGNSVYAPIDTSPFYKKMDVNVVDENDGLEDTHQLPLEYRQPSGEGDEDQAHKPGLSGPGNNLPRIEGAHERSAILALVPPKSACDEIAAAMGDDLREDPEDLHITLVYIGKNLSEETCSKIEACLDSVCSEHEPLHCKMQGLGVFDHEDDGGRPFYSSIDAVGMAKLRTELVEALESSGVDIEHKYDFTPHMTLGYIDPDLIDVTAGSPGIEWESDTIVFMNGDKHVDFKLGAHSKEAGGFGFNLLELTTPSKGDGFYQKDDQLSENTQEDPDLKLGDVEEPYSTGDGPINVRFDVALDPEKEYNITKGAAPKPLYNQDFTPEEEQDVRKEVSRWPQETKVLNDFMLERGHEPMVEEDVEPWPDNDRWDNIPDQTVEQSLSNALSIPVTLAGATEEINGALANIYASEEPPRIVGPIANKAFELYDVSWFLYDDFQVGAELIAAWGDGSTDRTTNLSTATGIYADPEGLARLMLKDILNQSLVQRPEISGNKDKEAIGQPDPEPNEGGYTDDYTRQDQTIPRDPSNEGPLYGR